MPDIFIPPGLPTVPVDQLTPYDRNSRVHSKSQVREIADSIRAFGFNAPIGTRQGKVAAGHGRLKAAKLLGMPAVPIVALDHLSDEQFMAYCIADNKIHDNSHFDQDILREELAKLKALNVNLEVLGFNENELRHLVPDPIGGGAGGASAQLLTYIDVTIAEPKHVVAHGDVYRVRERHLLIVASVITDWRIWAPRLIEGSTFIPYPGVFVPFSERAAETRLVMVQPDPYIAGHLLDRISEIDGEQAIEREVA